MPIVIEGNTSEIETETEDQKVETQNETTVFPGKTEVDLDQGRDLALSLFLKNENTKTTKRTKLKTTQKT